MSGGRTQKAVRNIAYNFTNQFLNLIFTFLSRTVFIRVLGAEYLGINGLFSDVLGLLSLADLGFNTAVVYSFYKPLAENDNRKMAALTAFYKKVYHMIAAAAGAAGVLLVPVLPYVVNLDHKVPHLYVYYLVSVADIAVSYLCVYRTSILTADQKDYYVVRIRMFVNCAKTILQTAVLLAFKTYLLYLLVGMAGSFLGNWAASRKAARMYPFIGQEEQLGKEEQKEIFSNIGAVFIYRISSVLLNATDNILISVIVGTVAVGYYSNYLMISNKLTQFYALFFTSLIAGIGNLVVKESAGKRYKVFLCEQTISFLIGCIIFPCYINLANDFVRLWLGADFVLPGRVVWAAGANLYLACIYRPLWSYREAVGLYKKTKWVMLLCGLTNIVLSVVLGLKWGLFGILAASCISRLATYVWIEPRILFHEYFERSAVSFYGQLGLNAAVVVVVAWVTGILSSAMEIQTWGSWTAKAAMVILAGLTVSILVYHRTEGFGYLWRRVLRIWKK